MVVPNVHPSTLAVQSRQLNVNLRTVIQGEEVEACDVSHNVRAHNVHRVDAVAEMLVLVDDFGSRERLKLRIFANGQLSTRGTSVDLRASVRAACSDKIERGIVSDHNF